MKLIIFLLIFSISSFACRYTSDVSKLDGEALKLAESITGKCHLKRNKKTACRCAKKYEKNFPEPEIEEEQLTKLKQVHLNKFKLSMLDISDKMLMLDTDSDFANDEELGRYCELDKVFSCSSKSSEKKAQKNLISRFKNSIDNNYSTSNQFKHKTIIIPPVQTERAKCGISDKTIYKINMEKSRLQLGAISQLINPNETNAQNLNDLLKLSAIKASEKGISIETVSNLYTDMINTNPLINFLAYDPEEFKLMQENNFNSEYLWNRISSRALKDKLKTNIVNTCTKQREISKEIFCSENPLLPKGFKDFKAMQYEAGFDSQNLLHKQEYTTELISYCSQKESVEDDLITRIKALLPERNSQNNGKSFQDIKKTYYKNSIHGRAEFLCNKLNAEALAKAKDTPLAEQNGCKEKFDSDCMFLKAFDALYKDEYSKPGATVGSVFKADTKKSILVKTFQNKELTQTEQEVAVAAKQEREVQREFERSGGNQRIGKVTKLAGDKTQTQKTTRGERASVSDDYQNHNSLSGNYSSGNNSVEDNMRNLYNEVSRRIRKSDEAQLDSMQAQVGDLRRQLNSPGKQRAGMSAAMKEMLSGSTIPNYSEQYAQAKSDELIRDYEMAGGSVDNYRDLLPANEAYDEESPEEAMIASRNRALRDMNRARGKTGTVASDGAGPSPASVSRDANDVATIEIDGNFDDVLKSLSENDFAKEEEELISVLKDDNKKVFYLKHKNKNFEVKVVKVGSGDDATFKVEPFGSYSGIPQYSRQYNRFLDSVRKSLTSNFNVSSLVRFLQGDIEQEEQEPSNQVLGDLFNT